MATVTISTRCFMSYSRVKIQTASNTASVVRMQRCIMCIPSMNHTTEPYALLSQRKYIAENSKPRNTHGSVVWFMLGMHMMHLCILTTEAVLLAVWIFTREYDMKHRVDIVTVAIYWYWVTAIWLLLYAIIYFTPRLG